MRPQKHGWWIGAGIAIVGAIVLAIILSVSGTNRPSLDQWEPAWREIVAGLPVEQDVTGDDGAAACADALGTLRQASVDLIPSPSDDLDAAVHAWIAFGESLYFECPIRSGDHAGFAAGYEEVRRLTVEIEALIAFDRSLNAP